MSQIVEPADVDLLVRPARPACVEVVGPFAAAWPARVDRARAVREGNR